MSIRGIILMYAGLDVPAGEVAAVGTREGARAHTADRRALPIAVVNVGAIFRYARVLERKSDGAAPCGFRYLAGAECGRCPRDQEETHDRPRQHFLGQDSSRS